MYARRQRQLEAQRQAKKDKSARARSRHCLYFCHLGTSVHVRKKCVCVRARMQVDLIRSSKPRSCLQGAARVRVLHTSMIRPKWPCAGCFLPENATQATLALWYKTEWRMKP